MPLCHAVTLIAKGTALILIWLVVSCWLACLKVPILAFHNYVPTVQLVLAGMS